MRNVFFIPRPRIPCDMHGTTNLFLTTIHGLDHNLMQLLNTSDWKMVMYNNTLPFSFLIALDLNGIFRRNGEATE